MLLDQAFVSGGNFALGVLLARFLGMEAFGEYSLLWMGVLFVLSLHQAYMTQPLMSLFAGKKTEGDQYLKSLFNLQLTVSAGLVTLGAVAFFATKLVGISHDWAMYLLLGGFISAAYLLQDFLRRAFFVKQQFRQPLLMDGVLYGILFLALVVGYRLGILDLITALCCLCLAYGASGLLGCFFAQKAGLLPLFKAKNKEQILKTAKEHYHYSYWLLGTSLVQWFSGNFFLIAAAGTLGTVAVGALRMAQNMVGLCHVLFLAMENIVPAEAAQHFFEHGKEKMLAYLRRVSLLVGIPVLGMLATLTLASPWLIGKLYGTEYQSFSYLVGAYSVLYVFVYIGFPLRFALRTLQYTSPIFLAYCGSAGVSLLVAFPMARAWGMSGVMAGLIATQLLTILVYAYFIQKKSAELTSSFTTKSTLTTPRSLST
ncbi:MAG: oligosaccharide flippase family protein [Saprospiraceae bacterium]|nr:oligosaccharide flippase family protein [Saprospiraceae bacterium]MCF8249882.1 oligosaccharide flippase family protein [Saprospiraceae bacterium]MCF8279448.1 oligosaccharide flippase family protein [Bacteroidales bacterium]MCF8311684.1 oligosaccharide flippase family protein [Saprospiraceae bacterium]MCF8440251.1 oligosaccharide flippase family protein [Saprospiraceae bacterium]